MVIEHVDAEAEVLEIEEQSTALRGSIWPSRLSQRKYMDMEIQLSDKAIYMDLGYSESKVLPHVAEVL